jgi:hypothetical protein
MKKIIALSGVSGVGKTYARTHDPDLKDLPQLDIMDIYRKYPGIVPERAFGGFLGEVQMLINKHDTIVLEAYFRPGSKQRMMLEWIAEGVNASVEYRELFAPLAVCRARVLADAKDMSKDNPGDPFWKDYTEVRLKLLELMAP